MEISHRGLLYGSVQRHGNGLYLHRENNVAAVDAVLDGIYRDQGVNNYFSWDCCRKAIAGLYCHRDLNTPKTVPL